MLLRISKFDDLDERKLMDIYSESNFENTDYFFPDLEDKKEAVRKVEEGFLGFLKDEFFSQSGSEYWVLESDGVWVSALRLSRIEKGLYYLEALETRPDCRRQGHAARLLGGVIDELKKAGPFRICDCISKRNTASIKTHEKCGFSIVSEAGYDYLLNESDDHDYGLEYRFIS
ncbi:MAG: GNAT family N-acetyltransferase [Spirochaetales bacterium]|nr:GNAT family N-acetyltransferase [Spirochaetales bacterium]